MNLARRQMHHANAEVGSVMHEVVPHCSEFIGLSVEHTIHRLARHKTVGILAHHLLDDFARDVRQAFIAPAVAESQFLVMESQ